MMVRAEYCAVVLAIVLPILLISMISDLSRRGYVNLIIILLTMAVVYCIHRSSFGSKIEEYLDVGSRIYVFWLSVFLAFGTLIFGVKVMRRRAIASMNWPSDILQQTMEHYGLTQLKAGGWDVMEQASFSGILVYWCKKNDLRMSVVFTKDSINYELFVNAMKSRKVLLPTVVVLSYRAPSINLQKIASIDSVLIHSYKDLPRVDEIVSEREKRRLAERTRVRRLEAEAKLA